MRANPQAQPPAVPEPAPTEAHFLHKPAFIAFLLLWSVNWLLLLLKIELPNDGRWPEGLLLLAATLTLLIGLSRRLPVQNVVMSAGLIAVISGGLTALNSATGIPFGPRHFSSAMGEPWFGVLPWASPLIWIVAIVSARGVARLMVRPWRKTSHYGFWVIGLSVALVLVFDLGLEPHATRARHYWMWRTPGSVLQWYGAPWVNFLGWSVGVLGVLVVTTPWLINKQPIKQPTDYHPLIVWLLLNLYLTTSAALHGFWLAVFLCLAAGIVATVFAIRGGRW